MATGQMPALKRTVAVVLALAATCAAAQELPPPHPPAASPVDELPPPVPPPAPPQCGSATDGSNELLGKIQTLREELTATKAALKEAVDAKNYAAAAEHQAKEAELTASLAELKKARAAACGPDGLPQPADDMRAVAMRAWGERATALLAPLEPAINTTLAIMHQGLTLAAAEGSMKIRIVPSSPTARPPPPAAVDYSMGWGSCQVPVGKGLTEELVAKFRANFQQQQHQQRQNHQAVYGALTGHAIAPVAVDDCSEEQLQSYAATFDGDTLHAAEDLWRVLRSPVGFLSLRWRLHEAGYATRVELNSKTQDEYRGVHQKQTRNHFDLARVVSMEVAYGRAGEALKNQMVNQYNEQSKQNQHLERSETFVEFVEAEVQRLSDLA
eukprot:COSAG02_NODE_186_length_30414_cov_24.815372_13_plen_384_part_00